MLYISTNHGSSKTKAHTLNQGGKARTKGAAQMYKPLGRRGRATPHIERRSRNPEAASNEDDLPDKGTIERLIRFRLRSGSIELIVILPMLAAIATNDQFLIRLD